MNESHLYNTPYGPIKIEFKDDIMLMSIADPSKFDKEELKEDLDLIENPKITRSLLDIEDSILEGMICNGWTYVNPEEIGALTDAPIISNDFKYNNEDDDTKTYFSVCAYMDYQVRSFADDLLENGIVYWQWEKIKEE